MRWNSWPVRALGHHLLTAALASSSRARAIWPGPALGARAEQAHVRRRAAAESRSRRPPYATPARPRPTMVEISTATNSAAPLNTSLIQLATPASESPVTREGQEEDGHQRADHVEPAGPIAVAPRNAAASACSVSLTVPT